MRANRAGRESRRPQQSFTCRDAGLARWLRCAKSSDWMTRACLLMLAGWLSLGGPATAQNSSINLPPGWKQVPQGTGACSVAKSCAELAPEMIQSALKASPLEENLERLARLDQSGLTGSRAAESAVAWAAEALRQSGAERVVTERFKAPGSDAGETVMVSGEIRGREKPEDFVVLGARFAAPESGDSVVEAGADAAVIIDSARVIQGSGSIPRRSVRIVVFVGTKDSQPGARAYLAAHSAELDRTMAAILLGVGTEPITGYSLNGRQDIQAAAGEALAPVRALGVKEFTLDAELRADSLDFVLQGIPTLVANADLKNRVPCARTDRGTCDPATVAELKRHVAIAAVTSYALADAEERIGPRQTRAGIEQLMKDTGLDQQMKQEGLWSAWQSGERGRRQ